MADACGDGFVPQSVGEIERGERNCTLQTVARLAKALKCEPVELFLFDPKAADKSLSVLDAHVADLWKAAGDKNKRKAIRILSELL